MPYSTTSFGATSAVSDYHRSLNLEMQAARRQANLDMSYNQATLAARPAPELTPMIHARMPRPDDEDGFTQAHTVTRFVF